MSTERIFVPASRYDELVSALREAWKTLKNKEARALCKTPAAERVNEMIADAKRKGAKPLLDPKEYTQNDEASGSGPAFIQPNIFGPATEDMKIFREETFGPVSIVIPIEDIGRDEEHVITDMVNKANDSEYGLTAAVWSKELSKAKRVARRLEAGAIHINSPVSKGINPLNLGATIGPDQNED